MKKKSVIAAIGKFACMVPLMAMLTGCNGKDVTPEPDKPAVTLDPADTTEPIATTAPESPDEPEETPAGSEEDVTEPVTAGGRADGERFEDTIMIEGMEEIVKYEHVKNEAIGFEMDYDYESLARSKDAGVERFVSVYDNSDSPENYLEVTFSPEDRDTASEAIQAKLMKKYDVMTGITKLDNAGDCFEIDALWASGGGPIDRMQMVYIIPVSDGCVIAAAHFASEAAEGFGRRFAEIVNTITIIDRTADSRLSDDEVFYAIVDYCHDNYPDLDKIIEEGDYPTYWDIESTSDKGVVILFRSYTGAQVRYYVDPYSGDTYVTEYVPAITPNEEMTETRLNVRYYLNAKQN